MKTFKTTNGYEVIVDDDWYDDVIAVSWNAIGSAYKYASSSLKGKHYSLHRLIVGALKDQFVDHINGNTLDNRKENLRICLKIQNHWNSKRHKDNSGRFKGVTRRSRKCFRSTVTANGIRYQLGHFRTEVEAALAYNQKAKELFGEFARLNEI